MQSLIRGRLYYAGPGFTHRGVWLWTGKQNVRVIPLNRFREWMGPKA